MRVILALSVLLFAAPAAARPTEVIVSAGIVSPAVSPYRTAAETLGYDRRGFRHVYEGEVALVQALTWWGSVGPLARFYYGDLASPYGGVPSIATYAGSLGVRGELELFPKPRLFVWFDPSFGVGRVGDSTVTTWGLRGGVGIGSVRDATAIRVRFGYAYAPTLKPVTAAAGDFNYGGFVFQIDGVFRAAR